MRTLRSWLYAFIGLFIALQLSSAVALVLLQRLKHIAYAPMPVNSLTKPQRMMLNDFLGGRGGHVAYSSVLGWTANPSGRAPLYRAISAGVRGDREFTLVARRGVVRIATFGAFDYGADVELKGSWPEVMMRAHRNVEVLNFGVQDFGVDQALLRYEHDGAAYKPDIVIMQFFPETIYLSVNVYRPFYYQDTDLPLTKPRYVLQGARLVFLPTPLHTLRQYADLLTNPARVLPVLGRHDYFYQSAYHRGRLAVLPSTRLLQILRHRLVDRRTAIEIEKNGLYNTDSEAFKVTAAIFDEFVAAARRAGSVPIIVTLPHAADIDRYRRDRERTYAPLLERFQAKGYRYVDMLDGFEEYGNGMSATDLEPSGYSPAGNRVVAKALWEFLVAQRLTDPKNLKSR